MKDGKIKVVISIIAVLIGIIVALNCGAAVLRTQAESSRRVLFLDPGHGGMDGGAVSSSGVPEKDINLAIALQVKKLAEEYGWQVVMTRETDEELYDSDEGSIRAMKTADLRVRRDMLKKYRPQVAVSIHLNSFKEDPSVKGVQVFYPNWGEGGSLQQQCKKFADVMQDNMIETVKAEKKRTPLVREGVFLFKEQVCPIVIVECGFLSNRDEAELLQTRTYQKKLAEGIMAGITEFTGVEKEITVELIDSGSKKNSR